MISTTQPTMTVALPAGPVLPSLQQAGVFLQTPCGGTGRCAKCRVVAREGVFNPPDAAETNRLDSADISRGIRLACRLTAMGQCRLGIPRESLVPDADIAVHVLDEDAPVENEYGLAVDLGTTRMTVLLLRMSDQRPIARADSINPQIYYGMDILTRLKAATEGAAAGLKEAAVQRINTMIHALCRKVTIGWEQIAAVCLVGNTAMTHLLLEMDVSGLIRAPYMPFSTASHQQSASRSGLLCHPDALLTIPPAVGGFVGSDHTAVIAALAARRVRTPCLALDIGTNTEIVIERRPEEMPISLSVPSGPAFEGGHVSCGQVAGNGVVDRLSIHDNGFEMATIGGDRPTGLCGSALIQLLAEAYRHGIIDRRGKIIATSSFVIRSEFGPAIELLSRDETQDGDALLLTQQDIDALLLAKAAVRTGIDLLLDHAGVSPGDIQTVVLSGAFGSRLDIAAAHSIGLFPESLPGPFVFLPDAAAIGAALLLRRWLNRKNGQPGMISAPKAAHINLVEAPGFKKTFARSFYFPVR